MATAKAAVATALGAFAGLYDKVRKDPVSRMLRDDYTALNMASFSYTMLHTTALAFHDEPVASLALKHLQDLTPLIMHLNEVVPHVVVKELQDEGPGHRHQRRPHRRRQYPARLETLILRVIPGRTPGVQDRLPVCSWITSKNCGR